MRRRLDERTCNFCGNTFAPYRRTQECCNNSCTSRYRLEKKGTKYIKHCTECGKRLSSKSIKVDKFEDVLCDECHYHLVEMSKSKLSRDAKAAKEAGLSYGYYMAGCKSGMRHIVMMDKVDGINVIIRR